MSHVFLRKVTFECKKFLQIKYKNCYKIHVWNISTELDDFLQCRSVQNIIIKWDSGRYRSFIQRILCQTIVKRELDFEEDLFAFNQGSNSIFAPSTFKAKIGVAKKSNWIVTIGAYHSMTVKGSSVSFKYKSLLKRETPISPAFHVPTKTCTLSEP